MSEHHQTCQLQFWQLSKTAQKVEQNCQRFVMDEVIPDRANLSIG